MSISNTDLTNKPVDFFSVNSQKKEKESATATTSPVKESDSEQSSIINDAKYTIPGSPTKKIPGEEFAVNGKPVPAGKDGLDMEFINPLGKDAPGANGAIKDTPGGCGTPLEDWKKVGGTKPDGTKPVLNDAEMIRTLANRNSYNPLGNSGNSVKDLTLKDAIGNPKQGEISGIVKTSADNPEKVYTLTIVDQGEGSKPFTKDGGALEKIARSFDPSKVSMNRVFKDTKSTESTTTAAPILDNSRISSFVSKPFPVTFVIQKGAILGTLSGSSLDSQRGIMARIGLQLDEHERRETIN